MIEFQQRFWCKKNIKQKFPEINDVDLKELQNAYKNYASLGDLEQYWDEVEKQYCQKYGYIRHELPADSWELSPEWQEIETQSKRTWIECNNSLQFDIIDKQTLDRLYHFARRYLCFSTTWIHFFAPRQDGSYKLMYCTDLDNIPTKLWFGKILRSAILEYESETGEQISKDYDSLKEFLCCYMLLVVATNNNMWTLNNFDMHSEIAGLYYLPIKAIRIELAEWLKQKQLTFLEAFLINSIANQTKFFVSLKEINDWAKNGYNKNPLQLIKTEI